MITENEEKISLYYNEGRSDKVYQVQLNCTAGGYVVNFQFGRRGSTLQSGTKTPAPVPYEKAKNIYDRLVAEKKGKGYTQDEDGMPYQNSEQAGRQSGLLPQLLNSIDEARIAELIAASHWCMQEKKDGCRLLVRKSGDVIEGINRKGMFVGMSTRLNRQSGKSAATVSSTEKPSATSIGCSICSNSTEETCALGAWRNASAS